MSASAGAHTVPSAATIANSIAVPIAEPSAEQRSKYRTNCRSNLRTNYVIFGSIKSMTPCLR